MDPNESQKNNFPDKFTSIIPVYLMIMLVVDLVFSLFIMAVIAEGIILVLLLNLYIFLPIVVIMLMILFVHKIRFGVVQESIENYTKSELIENDSILANPSKIDSITRSSTAYRLEGILSYLIKPGRNRNVSSILLMLTLPSILVLMIIENPSLWTLRIASTVLFYSLILSFIWTIFVIVKAPPQKYYVTL